MSHEFARSARTRRSQTDDAAEIRLTLEDHAIFIRAITRSQALALLTLTTAEDENIDARASAALCVKREREWRVYGRRVQESFDARADVQTYRRALEAEHGEPLL